MGEAVSLSSDEHGVVAWLHVDDDRCYHVAIDKASCTNSRGVWLPLGVVDADAIEALSALAESAQTHIQALGIQVGRLIGFEQGDFDEDAAKEAYLSAGVWMYDLTEQKRRIDHRAGASVCSEYPECRSLDDDCGGCWACDGGSNNTPPPCNPASCGDGHTCRASEESA